MGKIRVSALGDEELEKKQKEEARLAREAKRAKKKTEEKQLVKGSKGGERLVTVGPTEEELARLQLPSAKADGGQAKTGTAEEPKKKKAQKKKQKQGRSKNYQAIAKLVDKTKAYLLIDALKLLPQVHLADFDETVELHINTTEPGISGTTTLPHGSGKEIRVAIATDELIEKIAKSLPASADAQASGRRGKINFDVLLATPNMMPKLAKVARFLGPRGLMPNPKAGTITNDPEKAVKSFQKGQINFKTELKAPIIHLRVGKLSFGEKKLEENIKTVIEAIRKERIKSITLKSTMSPGIKIDLSK